MAGDLHLHTTYSDGSTKIEQLVKFASNLGLAYIAVSDHDTAKSIQYAQLNKEYNGTKLIPAVEISCKDFLTQRSVHLLCYYPKITAEFLHMCETMAKNRNKLAEDTLVTLKQQYPAVPWEMLSNYSKDSGVTFKTHLMKLLFEFGYADGLYGNLFKQIFTDEDSTDQFAPDYVDLDEALNIIKGMGAVCVVAHPSVYKSVELCERLAKSGDIDGIEIHHMRNTESDKVKLWEIAKKYSLIVTGGTDFHGMHMPRPKPIGSFTTELAEIEKIEKLAKERGNL